MNINSCLKLFNSTSVLLGRSALLTSAADTRIHTEQQFHNRASTHFDDSPFSPPSHSPSSSPCAISVRLSVNCRSKCQPCCRQSNAALCTSLLELSRERQEATWHLTDFLSCLLVRVSQRYILQSVWCALQGAPGLCETWADKSRRVFTYPSLHAGMSSAALGQQAAV